MNKIFASCAVALIGIAGASPCDSVEPVTIIDQPGWCNWCPSPAYLPDGRVALAFSRWPTKFGFETWKAKSEIALAISKSDPLGPYEFVGTILPGSERFRDRPFTFGSAMSTEDLRKFTISGIDNE